MDRTAPPWKEALYDIRKVLRMIKWKWTKKSWGGIDGKTL